MKLSAEQMTSIFRSASDQDPLFKAVMQLLEDEFLDAVAGAIHPDVSNDSRNYNSGRASMAHDLKATILQARKPKE